MKRNTRTTIHGKRMGRPPKPIAERLVPLSVRVHPSIRAKFIRHCARLKLSQARVFSRWVERMK